MNDKQVAQEILKVARMLVSAPKYVDGDIVYYEDERGQKKEDVVVDTKREKGKYVVKLEKGGEVPEDKLRRSSQREAAERRIEVVNRIIEHHQAEKIDGYLVDAMTAQALKAVHDALRPELQKKFDRIPLKKLVDFAWGVVK